jgi:hypothetical protein
MDPLKTINPKMTLPTRMSGASSLAFPMTASERAAGRFLRAPDHDAGTGGGEGGAAKGAESADAGAAAAAGGEGEAKPAEGAAAAEGADAGSGADAGAGADAGKGEDDAGKGGDDDSSIAGGAGAKKDGEEGDAKPQILGAPEAYDVKVPEALAEKGMTFDKEVFDLVAPELKAMDLSNDAAQRLTNVYAEKVVPALVERGQKQAEAAQETRSAEIRKEWADASRADPEIGGANFDKTVDAAAAVWDKFGIKPKEGIRLLLDESGIGNHPDMLRFLSRVAAVTGEGKFVQSDGAGSDNRPVWDRVYGQPEPAK